MLKHWVSAVALGIVCAVSTAQAQSGTSSVPAGVLERLAAGTVVRVRDGDHAIIGRVERVTLDSLYLDSAAFKLNGIEGLDVRLRSTKRGLKLGAYIGLPSGLLFGAFVAWIATALCESGCEDDAALWVEVPLVFGTLGLVGGASLGAAVGASLPRWVDVTSSDFKSPGTTTATRTIGSASITPAFARLTYGTQGGLGVRAAYMFQTPKVSVGPEIGWYSLGENVYATGNCSLITDQYCTNPTRYAPTRAFHAGGVARVGTGVERAIEPYATLGGGVYTWWHSPGFVELFGGYSAGAGVQVRNATRRRSLLVEGRWQSNFTRTGGSSNGPLGFYTLGVGGAIAW